MWWSQDISGRQRESLEATRQSWRQQLARHTVHRGSSWLALYITILLTRCSIYHHPSIIPIMVLDHYIKQNILPRFYAPLSLLLVYFASLLNNLVSSFLLVSSGFAAFPKSTFRQANESFIIADTHTIPSLSLFSPEQ